MTQTQDPISSIHSGPGGLPAVTVRAGDGATAQITLHGGHVISWRPAGDDERLFLSRAAHFGAEAAIRGGVPVIFPQFAGEGPLPKHGFARTALWTLTDLQADEASGHATARLELRESAATLAIWPHAFGLELAVTVGGPTLHMALTVTNRGDEAFSFTGALHTYLRVTDVTATQVLGLTGGSYRDSALGGVMGMQTAASPTFGGEVDRIYFDAGPVTVQEAQRGMNVSATGFPDVVVWNPGPVLGGALGDMEPDGYRRMLCVEAAAIGQAAVLGPGRSWTGSQTLRADQGQISDRS